MLKHEKEPNKPSPFQAIITVPAVVLASQLTGAQAFEAFIIMLICATIVEWMTLRSQTRKTRG